MGIIAMTMIMETTMAMTPAASMEEALAAVADSDDAINGGEASGSKTTPNICPKARDACVAGAGGMMTARGERE